MRGDLIRDDEVDLVAVLRVSQEHQLHQFALVLRDDGIDNRGRILLDVHQQTGQVVERNVILDAVNDGFDLQTIEARSLRIQRHTKGLHLHGVFSFVGKINLRLEVYVVGESVVQNVHGSQLGTHFNLRGGGVRIHGRGYKASLTTLSGSDVVIQLYDLIGPKRYVLSDNDGDRVQRDYFVEFVQVVSSIYSGLVRTVSIT
mmetsp:Transcript_9064/g.15028  ORF Transcript_9064/g.15028 Transcript_9064/m.15028 type:complete len:201 (+) Transcript_9064:1462-2064(+)